MHEEGGLDGVDEGGVCRAASAVAVSSASSLRCPRRGAPARRSGMFHVHMVVFWFLFCCVVLFCVFSSFLRVHLFVIFLLDGVDEVGVC